MALSYEQQIIEQFNTATRILITGVYGCEGDSVASALALGTLLQKLGIHVDIAFDYTEFPTSLRFLPEYAKVKNNIGQLQELIINIPQSSNNPITPTYYKKENAIEIHLNPKQGVLDPNTIQISQSNYKYDVIVVVGSPDLESIGSLYRQYTDFFYHTPIVNIDHHASNEHFGTINYVDITASSTSEVIWNLSQILGPELIDKTIATYLYTGMVVQTNSFKKTTLTPTTLHIASQLIASGADRETVIQYLYRTKSVHMLKLWGRALARLTFNTHTGIAVTQLSTQDFVLTSTTADQVEGVIDELISETPSANIVILLYETKNSAQAIVHTSPNYNALTLTARYDKTGHRQRVHIEYPGKTIVELERELRTYIESQLDHSSIQRDKS